MGASLIAQVIVIDENKTPDWTAASEAIQAMSLDDLRGVIKGATGYESWDDETEMSEDEILGEKQSITKRLLEAMEFVKLAYNDSARDSFSVNIRGAKVLVTGEIS